MSVKEMYMGREMTGTTTLAESVYNEMGGDTPLITESQTVKGAVNELKTIEGTEAYDNTATYAVGDYCIYNSTRYKCITAVTTAEDFDSTKWSATTTNNDITQLNSSLTDVISKLFDIRIGTVSVARQSGRNTAQATFDTPFSGTENPYVVCFIHTSAPQTFFVSADNVSTTGFQANLYNNGTSASSNASVRYIAIRALV